MTALVERAEELAAAIRTATGAPRATTEIRNAVPPCVLVVPVPSRRYLEGATLGGEFEVVWTLHALATGTGDRRSAEQLEELVDAVAEVLPIESAEPGGYQIPGAEQAVPAYAITYREQATP